MGLFDSISGGLSSGFGSIAGGFGSLAGRINPFDRIGDMGTGVGGWGTIPMAKDPNSVWESLFSSTKPSGQKPVQIPVVPEPPKQSYDRPNPTIVDRSDPNATIYSPAVPLWKNPLFIAGGVVVVLYLYSRK